MSAREAWRGGKQKPMTSAAEKREETRAQRERRKKREERREKREEKREKREAPRMKNIMNNCNCNCNRAYTFPGLHTHRNI